MGHDGEGDRPIDVVEPAGPDSFAVNELGGKQVASALRPDLSRPERATDLQSRKAIYFDQQSRPYYLGRAPSTPLRRARLGFSLNQSRGRKTAARSVTR
jgi:hypothetical protein